MPTVVMDYRDLIQLIGREYTIQELEEALFLTKCEVEKIEGGEITIEVNSDRPDMLSTEGIARNLRGFLGLEIGTPKYRLRKGKVRLSVLPSVSRVRPYIVCGVVRDLNLTDEIIRQIMQLQEKLHLTHCRNRRKGSIGIYDLDKIEPEIIYEAVGPKDIEFIPLEETRRMSIEEIADNTAKGREYSHIVRGFGKYPLLRDSKGTVLSIPPIINSEDTRVSLNTKHVLVDVTGTDKRLIEHVLNILVTSLADRGGKLRSVPIREGRNVFTTPDLTNQKVRLKIESACGMLGLKLSPKEIVRCLRKMRYDVRHKDKKTLEVSIPAYRCDILHEVDLIEDVAIGYGYNKFMLEIPATTNVGKELGKTRFARRVRDLMIGFGFQEVLNFIMTSKRNLFANMNRTEEKVVEVLNPVSSEYAVLRDTLIPGLLDLLSQNLHIQYPQRIFECGDMVRIQEEGEYPKSVPCLAAAICDNKASYEEAQSVVYSIFRELGVTDWEVYPCKHASYLEGRAAKIGSSEEAIAVIGEVHPRILEQIGLNKPVAVFEINLESIFFTD
jgi:phenylalanyl-tRNA synthetase beta chain